MLGIVIGISSVIILMSIGQSAQDYILAQVQGLGIKPDHHHPGARTTESSHPLPQRKASSLRSLDAAGRRMRFGEIRLFPPVTEEARGQACRIIRR